MAAATCINTEYGYMITGDTGAVTVSADSIRVKAMAFSGNADNATCTLTHLRAGSATSCYKFKTNGNDLDASAHHVYFGEHGAKFTGLAVTLSNAGDHLYIFLATR